MPLMHNSIADYYLNHPAICKILNSKESRGDKWHIYICYFDENFQQKSNEFTLIKGKPIRLIREIEYSNVLNCTEYMLSLIHI